MRPKINLILFIKISVIILLTWICYFNNDIKTLAKSIHKNCGLDRKSDTINCRLLAKYKQDKDSNNLELKDYIPNDGESKKRNKSNNEKGIKGTKKLSNRSILNKAQYYTDVVDYNSGMFDGKHFHFEKKWIKKKDYDNFLKKKRRLCDIALKKVKFKNYVFGVAIFFTFFLLGIGLPILRGFQLSPGSAQDQATIIDANILEFLKEILGLQKEGYVYILFFAVTFIMLSILIIVAIYKILRNNEKYQKIKLLNEGYE
ncbi:fam-m protein [Plasmodium malariae]|uniref:Fam-m protein n=1 Tax=Plasmodium malariae TaxID=5858 RepID=A0A1D3JL04_PLAMA|nr:fam-m protein [Plasmodium malariae]SBT87257.1 fam-m protein [Plasmodium malariae]